MQRTPFYRHILQFLAIRCTAKQQSSAAHISAPNEIRREIKICFEDLEQDVNVLPGSDTSEQHYFGFLAHTPCKVARITHKWPRIRNHISAYLAFGKSPQVS